MAGESFPDDVLLPDPGVPEPRLIPTEGSPLDKGRDRVETCVMGDAQRRGWRPVFWEHWRRRGARRQQLEGEIDALKAELDWRTSRDSHSPPIRVDCPPALKQAKGLLETARQAAEDGRISAGYEMLNGARRLAVDAYQPQEVRAASIGLIKESEDEKLTEWRGETIRSILVSATDGRVAACRDDQGAKDQLRVAMRIRDNGLANQYRKAELLAENLRRLYVFLLLAISLMIPVVLLGTPDASQTLAVPVLAVVALFGAVGASLSAILSLSRADPRKRVPQHFTHGKIMFFRPLFGAGAALAAYVAFLAGIQSIAADPNADPLGPILVLAFTAGFSESYLLKAFKG